MVVRLSLRRCTSIDDGVANGSKDNAFPHPFPTFSPLSPLTSPTFHFRLHPGLFHQPASYSRQFRTDKALAAFPFYFIVLCQRGR
jgi:hypothetical protein